MIFKEFSIYCLTGFSKATLWDGQNRNDHPHFKDGETKALRGDALYLGPGPECSFCQYSALLPVFPLETLRETESSQIATIHLIAKHCTNL